MLIRPRQDTDLAACLEMLRRTHETDGYPVRVPQPAFLQPVQQVAAWVAVEAEAFLGHAMLCRGKDTGSLTWSRVLGTPADRVGEISRLFSDPATRGRHIGSALLGTAMDHARTLGLIPALTVLDDHQAWGRYERLGWTRQATGRFTFHDGSSGAIHYYLAP